MTWSYSDDGYDFFKFFLEWTNINLYIFNDIFTELWEFQETNIDRFVYFKKLKTFPVLQKPWRSFFEKQRNSYTDEVSRNVGLCKTLWRCSQNHFLSLDSFCSASGVDRAIHQLHDVPIVLSILSLFIIYVFLEEYNKQP